MTRELLDKLLSKEIIGPILVITCSILLYGILKRIIKKMFRINLAGIDENKNKTISGLICNVIKYLLILLDILIILGIFGVDTKALVASLGVVGVVVGLAIQDTLKDFFSGIFILSEDQYRVGDTVKIGSFKGEVIYLGLKTTRVKAYTGEIKIINNRNIDEVINYSKADSLALVDIPTSFLESTDKIEQVLEELCVQLSKELPYLRGKVESLGIVSLSDGCAEFRVVAPTEPMQHYDVERLIRRAVKEKFKQEKIAIPYPQLEVHGE